MVGRLGFLVFILTGPQVPYHSLELSGIFQSHPHTMEGRLGFLVYILSGPQVPYHSLELSGNPALHHNVSVSQGSQITIFHTTAVCFYQRTRKDPLLLLVASVIDRDYRLRAKFSEPGTLLPCLISLAGCLSRPIQLIMTEWSLLAKIVTKGSELRQRTCLPQSATSQFRSPILFQKPLALEIDVLSYG